MSTTDRVRIGTRGAFVSGLDEIEQSVRIVLGTQLGSVPQLRDYGIDWLEILDLPMSDAIPLTMRRAGEALRRWVPRAEVRSLTATPTPDGAIDIAVRLGVAGATLDLTVQSP